MHKILKSYIAFSLFLCLITYGFGNIENQSWTKISFEKKLPQSFKLEISQGLRLKDQFSTLNLAFFESSIGFKSESGIKITIPYRYTIFDDKIKHRVSLGVSYQYSIKSISLKSRIKYYKLYENGESEGENGNDLGNLVRSKFTIKYKTNKKINPYISGEIFHLFKTENEPFDEFRTSIGLEVDLPEKKSIYFFYTYKKENITDTNPNEINIFGLNYISKL